MNGIKNTSFAIFILALLGTIVYEYGKRQATVEEMFVRWDSYQAKCMKVAIFSLALWITFSLIQWIFKKLEATRARQDASLVLKTKQTTMAEIAIKQHQEEERKQKLFKQMGCDHHGYPIR